MIPSPGAPGTFPAAFTPESDRDVLWPITCTLCGGAVWVDKKELLPFTYRCIRCFGYGAPPQ